MTFSKMFVDWVRADIFARCSILWDKPEMMALSEMIATCFHLLFRQIMISYSLFSKRFYLINGSNIWLFCFYCSYWPSCDTFLQVVLNVPIILSNFLFVIQSWTNGVKWIWYDVLSSLYYRNISDNILLKNIASMSMKDIGL